MYKIGKFRNTGMLNLYLLLITFQSYNVGESPLSNLTKEKILHRQKFKIKSRINCCKSISA